MRIIAAALVLLAAVLVFLAGCPHPAPGPEPPRPIVDASPYDLDAEEAGPTCADFCQHAAAMGCRIARDTPRGNSCVLVCLNVVGSGIVTWDLACRLRAATCAAVEACEHR